MITDSEIWKILRWEAVCALILWLTCNTMLEKLLAANVVYDTSDDIKQTNDLVPLTNIVQLNSGYQGNCAIAQQGEAKCWGYFMSDGPVTHTHAVEVYGLNTTVKMISPGINHYCAVTSSGGALCWGWNMFGQLGSELGSLKPTYVYGLSSGVKSVTTGIYHTCALTDQGGVKCWGRNDYGQIGDGSYTDSSVPKTVAALTSGISEVSAGQNFNCALTDQDGVKCWGSNGNGELGNGTTISSSIPVDVTGLNTKITAINSSLSHTCALTLQGGVKCWGSNWKGQLGNGTINHSSTPVDVLGLSSGIIAISAGGEYTCALTDQGGIKCWGDNQYGQLGDGTTIRRTTPVDVTGLTGGVVAVDAGGDSTCALTTLQGVKCWGNNQYGRVGDGTGTNRTTPVTVLVEETAPTGTPTFTPTSIPTSTPNLTPTPTSTPVSNQQLFTISQNSWKFANKPHLVSWENYADAFGESNVQDANGKRLEFAEKYYNNVVKSVGDNGLCLGFATSAGMLFSGNTHVSSIPGYTKISDVPAPPTSGKYFQQGAIPDYLAKYHIYQLGGQYLSAGVSAIERPINETVVIVKNAIDQGLKDAVILTFYYVKYGNSSTCYAHTVLPFAYSIQGDSTLIEIYDSEFPGTAKTLTVNADGSWSYRGWNNTNSCSYNNNTYNSVIAAVRLSEFDSTPRLKDSQARTSMDNVTILSSPNAMMTVANSNVVPLLSSAQISDIVQAGSGTQYLLKDTETVSLTVRYALTSTTEIGLFNQGEYLGMVVGETTAGQQDVLVFDTAKAKVQLTAGATLSRTVEMINQQPNGEYVQKFTCSIPDSSHVSVASSGNQLQITSGSSLESCTLGVLLPSNENLIFQLPAILAQDTVTGTMLSEQGHILSLDIDHGSDGVVDDTRTINPGETRDINLYLPVIKR